MVSQLRRKAENEGQRETLPHPIPVSLLPWTQKGKRKKKNSLDGNIVAKDMVSLLNMMKTMEVYITSDIWSRFFPRVICFIAFQQKERELDLASMKGWQN